MHIVFIDFILIKACDKMFIFFIVVCLLVQCSVAQNLRKSFSIVAEVTSHSSQSQQMDPFGKTREESSSGASRNGTAATYPIPSEENRLDPSGRTRAEASKSNGGHPVESKATIKSEQMSLEGVTVSYNCWFCFNLVGI